jgi:hypothetical protein
MTIEFKNGDRVRVLPSYDSYGFFVGKNGVVVDDYLHAPDSVGISFDSKAGVDVDMHDCNGGCEDGYGWYVAVGHLSKIEETEVDTDNPLYNFRAHEELGEDAWGGLSKAVYEVVHNDEGTGLYTWEYVGPYFKQWELDYKKSTGLPIPGAWRSAKSVIKNAMNVEAAMWLDDEPRGKTAVEKNIKAARDKLKEDIDPQAQLEKLIERAMRYNEQHADTSWADAVHNVSSRRVKGDK